MPERKAKRTLGPWTSHYLLWASVSSSGNWGAGKSLRFHTEWWSTAVGSKLYLQYLTITSDIHLVPQCLLSKFLHGLKITLSLKFTSRSHEISQNMDFKINSNWKWSFGKSLSYLVKGKSLAWITVVNWWRYLQAYLVLLYFADIAGFFYKLKVCGNPALSNDG